MAVEFEPSKEISGGVWYSGGMIAKTRIHELTDKVFVVICKQGVATVDGVYDFINKRRNVLTFDLSKEQVGEIFKLMVVDNQIMEVKSTGLGEYNSIPVGAVCYRASTDIPIGTMASIPCGKCYQINLCTSDGIISPATCVHYNKWLQF